MKDEIVPPPVQGKNTSLETSVELANSVEARETFKRAYKRMLNPPVWHKVSGFASAKLMLTNERGSEENRLAEEGDYFRIDILGPGPSLGDGYDWVRVESIKNDPNAGEDAETYGMTLRPSAAPGKQETAHFFKETATSSFLIRREGNRVTASYHGRNEIPNNDTNNTKDNVRNSLVAMGAFAGLSELQWKALIKGFLEEEIGG
ncbi:MAG: hypothetical protein JWP81_2288 [Ferruginibacter sp.]|nr:hypothetical protein [Ferruginibacter sp.]